MQSHFLFCVTRYCSKILLSCSYTRFLTEKHPASMFILWGIIYCEQQWEMIFMGVFHWSNNDSRVGSKSQGSGTKIHKKGRENTGSVAPPRQDVIHPGLSGSRGRPALGSGCFLQDWSGNYQDKP